MVPEDERKAVEAADADAEQERQHSIREAGGVLAGDKLVIRHPTEGIEVVPYRLCRGSEGTALRLRWDTTDGVATVGC